MPLTRENCFSCRARSSLAWAGVTIALGAAVIGPLGRIVIIGRGSGAFALADRALPYGAEIITTEHSIGKLFMAGVIPGLLELTFFMAAVVIKGVVKDVSLEKVFLGVVPFLVANFILLVLLFLIPQLSLFIPRLMGS